MRKRKIVWTFLSAIVLLLSACTPAETPSSTSNTSDPRIPGGSINTDPNPSPVTNFKAVPQADGTILLSWINPSQYSTLPYQVVLFRKQCEVGGQYCDTPIPSSSATELLYGMFRGNASSYVDSATQASLPYTYWIYIYYNGSYSSAELASATALATPVTLASITQTNFWPNTFGTIGTQRVPNTNYSPSVYLFGAAPLNELDIGGKATLGANGTILYYADTSNNRVVIMAKQYSYACYSANFSDPLELQFCLMGFSSEPFVPVNILGQPDRSTILSCQDHVDQCQMTAQNVVPVAGSGNQTQYQAFSSTLPSTLLGTFQTQQEAMQASCENNNFCSFEGLQGSKSCTTKRNECMTAPTHVYVSDGSLLVSDTGNDRVLIYNTLPTQYSACDTNLGSDIIVQNNCSASAVIGKKNISDLTEYNIANFKATSPISINLPAGNTTLRIAARGALPFDVAGVSVQSVASGPTQNSNDQLIQIPETGKVVFDISKVSKANKMSLISHGGNQSWSKVVPGSYIEFQLNVATAGVYQIILTYSSTLAGTYADLLVDGTRQVSVPLDISGGGIATDGDKILSSPGALVVKDGNLLIADRGNNRIVRVRGYADTNLFNCNSDEIEVSGGLTYGDWGPLCHFDHVLGQQTLFENFSFSQLVFDKAAIGVNLISSDGAGNSLSDNYQGYLKRYFGKPTALKFADDGRLLVSADENFLLDSSDINSLTSQNSRYYDWYLTRLDKSPVALKSRILIFDGDKVNPVLPSCQPSVFGSGGCDASGVIGQLDFKTIPIFSGSAADDYRNSISYGLTYVTDFVINGNSLLATDGVTNDIYFWGDWTNDIQGRPFDFRIENPAGAAFPNYPNSSMPKLSSISGIIYDPITEVFIVTDPGSGLIYQIYKPR